MLIKKEFERAKQFAVVIRKKLLLELKEDVIELKLQN